MNENLSNFLGKEYLSPHLSIGVDIMYWNDSKVDDIISDIERIESTLEGLLAQDRNYSFVNELLEMIDVGKNVDGDYQSRQKFLANVYFSYGDYIKLDPSIIYIAKDSITRKSSFDLDLGETETSVGDEVIKGVIVKMQQYAEVLLMGKGKGSSQKKNSPTVVVNTVANATNIVNVDIDVEIQDAIKKVEDACLPDAQEKVVLAKIQELKEIVESKESKKSKWTKVREFFKWVAEQGIQVASIVIPLLVDAIK